MASVINAHTGDSVELTSLWQDRRILLVFLRHLGCGFSKHQLDEIAEIKDDLSKSGVKPVFVALGTLKTAKAFIDLYGNPGEFYIANDAVFTPTHANTFNDTTTDSSRETKVAAAYKMMHLGHDPESTLADRAKAVSVRGYKDIPDLGGSSEEYSPDTEQLGGVFLLGPGNQCEYAFRSTTSGDTPYPHEILLFVESSERDTKDEELPTKSTKSTEFTHPRTTRWVTELKMRNIFRAVDSDEKEQKLIMLGVVPILALIAGLTTLFFLSFAALSISYLHLVLTSPARIRSRAAKAKKSEPITIQLLSPQDIDQLMIEAGRVDCDHPSLLEISTKEDDKTKSVEEANKAESNEIKEETNDDENPAILSEYELVTVAEQVCFLREFLAKPHPLLHRPGPVCPFMSGALRQNSIHIGVVRTTPNVTQEEIVTLVSPLANKFATLEPTKTHVNYKALLLVFPDIVNYTDSRSLIDGAHTILKPSFVNKGLMLGEFHQYNNTPSLHNPQFYPLRTPFATLVIRNMVPEDLSLLNVEKYPPTVRVSLLSSYLAKFEDDNSLTPATLDRARSELQRAQKKADKSN
eukprot:TRINITY_DN15417_c0_g1_i1.p1 TRINITY_DN15417_c0_g1~~TRINITY_DN15417_c0_g1_i1.p1  ORF type:complete len:578 (-),score=106.51 TRINITY_DN15417_c0_g1_i1:58-1791(-)